MPSLEMTRDFLLKRAHFSLLCTSLLGLLLLVGCPPTTVIKKPQNTPLNAVLARIHKDRSAIQSLEGRAKLRIYQPNQRRQTLRMFFQLQRPDRLHLQVIAAAMQPVLIVTCDGKEFAIHNLLERRFLRGQASQLPRLLGDFLPTQIPLAQLIAALLGELPLLPAPQQSVRKDAQSGVMILERKGPNHQQTVWIDATHARFLKTQLETGKTSSLTLEYGTYRGNPPLPKRILFVMPQRKRRVHWIFSEPDINPKIPLKSFQQTPPKQVKVETIR